MEIQTKFHPILFSTPMVLAILEGRKTQTRRVVKPQPDYFINCVEGKPLSIGLSGSGEFYGTVTNGIDKSICAPYNVGDVLWVRENFYTASNWDHWKPSMLKSVNVEVFYAADLPNYDISRPLSRGIIRPCIFLPFEYSRIFLKIKSIKVERLQDISEEDAIAEGVEKIADYGTTGYRLYTEPEASYSDIDAISSFESLWQSINGKESLALNPFVWVYEFEQIEKPNDFIV